MTKGMTEEEIREVTKQLTAEREREAKRLYLRQRADRFLMGCVVSGITSFILFIPAFEKASGGTFGFWAILLAGCCVFCNYRRRHIEQQIKKHDY